VALSESHMELVESSIRSSSRAELSQSGTAATLGNFPEPVVEPVARLGNCPEPVVEPVARLGDFPEPVGLILKVK